MADEIDAANELADREREAQAKVKRVAPSMQPTGCCQNPNCELELDPNPDGSMSPRLFCDDKCAREFQQIIERKTPR